MPVICVHPLYAVVRQCCVLSIDVLSWLWLHVYWLAAAQAHAISSTVPKQAVANRPGQVCGGRALGAREGRCNQLSGECWGWAEGALGILREQVAYAGLLLGMCFSLLGFVRSTCCSFAGLLWGICTIPRLPSFVTVCHLLI